MRNPIFKNKSHQKLFDKQGYLVIDLISESQIIALKDLFSVKHKDLDPAMGFFSSSYSSDLDYKKSVSSTIVEILEPSYQRTFENYRPFGASFLFKMPTEHSELAAHQDWTIVEEDEYYALNCWIPLTEIHTENGPLMVLPGSHYDNYKTLRAPTLNFFFSQHEDIINDNLIPLIPKLGQAVILNQSLIHYSPPNRSDNIRLALTAGVKSIGAPMLFHYKNQAGNIEKYKMEEDFLISFENFMEDIFKQPKGEKIELVDYDDSPLSEEDLKKVIKKYQKQTRSGSWLSRIFN